MSNSSDFQKPDPQALLSEVMKEESRRGRFKIFLGYAPGVGKTYKMLEHARIAKERGIDVVVGVVETHNRAETEKLLEGLEIIARREIDYKNVVLYEMDVEAIIRRRPQLVLVDELAHTNAPGSQYEKRFQDIEILLANKINVYTTVNIQHIESLNDTVAQITGVRIRETVPDNIFDKADEIDVVDIPLEQLQERLKEGKVYAPDLAGKALENYFKRGNLLALREIAFRRAANKLDQELINYMKARGIAGPWAISERLLVCIGVSPFAKKLVRKAYQMASELKAEWYAVYVETPGHLTLSQKERINLTETLGLAQELGAKVITLTGSEIGQEIVKFANKEKISKVVIGKPVGFFLRQMLARSPVFEILKESGRFDLYFIAPESEEGSKADTPAVSPVLSSKRTAWKNYFLASLTILPVTAIASLLFYGLHIKSLIILFIMAPMASAFFFGIGPSLFVSFLSPLIYDYFFTEPYFSLTIQDPSIILELVIFVVTAVLTGQLANLIRRQQEAITSRLGQMELLSDMGKELLAIPNLYQLITKAASPMDEQMNNTLKFMKITVQEGIAETILRYMDRAIHLPCFVILRKEDSPLHIWAKSGSELSLTTKENAIVEWIFAHNEPAGKGTKTLEGSDYFYLPISSKKKCLGVIGISSDYNLLLPNERILISAINNFAATALDNLEIQTED